MSLVDWLAARIRCLLRGHDMAHEGRPRQCRRCGLMRRLHPSQATGLGEWPGTWIGEEGE